MLKCYISSIKLINQHEEIQRVHVCNLRTETPSNAFKVNRFVAATGYFARRAVIVH